jgi:drug/metabolite transporter (DMT)-like permease
MEGEKNAATLKRERHLSQISMLISAISMGFIGIFVDLLSRFPVYSIVFFRGLFGTVFLSLWLLKNKGFSNSFFTNTFKLHWKNLLILIIIYPAGIYFYFLNIQVSGYATAAFLLYLNGIFLLGILYITKKEGNIPKANIIGFIIAIIGVLVIMEVWNGLVLIESLIFGVTSAIFLAINIFIRKVMYEKRIESQLVNKTDESNFNTFLAWWACVTLIIFYLPIGSHDIIKLHLTDVVVCILLGLIPTALAFTLYNIAIKRDRKGSIVILGYFEPFVATINTMIFLQKFSIFTVLGGILIIIANIIIIKY